MADGDPLHTPVDAPVALLALEARQNRLAICAGSGISITVGLPNGTELAEKLDAHYRGTS